MLSMACVFEANTDKGQSNWEGNRQEGQGSPNGGNRLQVSDIFYLSIKSQEETNLDFFPFSIQI